MIVLAIETSCDETAAAVLDGNRVLSNIVWSQLKLHAQWGGVVPSLARRAHEERLPRVVAAALRRANLSNSSNLPNLLNLLNSVAAISVTVGPGLAPALEVGIAYAKKLALQHKKPLIPVSHLEGHIASAFLRRRSGAPYLSNSTNSSTWLSLIVSGGHTELTVTSLSNRHPERREQKASGVEGSSKAIPIVNHILIGQTLDDAAGECLDKVGRALGLGYPAGPVVEKLAREATEGSDLSGRSDPSHYYRFPIPMERSRKDNLNFSFSGLKTAAIRNIGNLPTHQKATCFRTWMNGWKPEGFRCGVSPTPHQEVPPALAGWAPHELRNVEISNFCASFQEAVISALLLKVRRAVSMTGIKSVFLSGGVAANNELRRRLRQQMRNLGGRAFCAPKKFTGDNAAMIGLAGQWALKRGEAATTLEEIEKIDRMPNLNFPQGLDNAPHSLYYPVYT